MDWVNILVTVLILILMIGILISTHELGHLLVAKAFKVYCFEYSIGFGPKLFSFRKKGGETDISLRALPLGGYVSMYGEGAEVPDGLEIPFSRSIEGVSVWKRVLIMLAGVMVNLFTAVLFTMIYATCIPNYVSAEAFDTGVTVNGGYASDESESTARGYSLRLEGGLGEFVIDESDERLYAPMRLTSLSPSDIDYPYLIDSSASLLRDEETLPVVAAFSYSTVNGNNDFLNGLSFYSPLSGSFITATQKAMGVNYFPDPEAPIVFQDGDVITFNITKLPVSSYDASPSSDSYKNKENSSLTLHVHKTIDGLAYQESGDLKVTIYTKWLPFGRRLLNGCYYIANFFTMIGQAFAMIFTGNFGAVGSIVAAGSQISTLTYEIGVARTFFFYGGFLGLNLAIFNLLPFPGLDGYQILVALVEKVFHKKIPPKVKNAISLVGLGLLFAFSFIIIVRDILRLF